MALLFSGPSWGQEAAPDRIVGAVPEEVEAFQRTLERFRARVAELEQHTLQAVADEKKRQRDRLTASYDVALSALDERERSQRAVAMTRFQDFLEDYPDIEYASEVRLRLAELYFQEAEDDWLAETDSYFEAMDAAGDDLDELVRLEEMGEPEIDLSKVVGLLQYIIDDNRGRSFNEQYELLDVAYYMLAFCFEQPNSKQLSRDAARATFRELVDVRPDSEYTDAAHLLLGNYAFDDFKFADSIPEFEAVLARGPEYTHYMAAMYQLAWARYKLDEYDDAMALFVELLDRSAVMARDTGRRSDYAEDAIDYLALSIIDQADAQGITPIERATQFFGGLERSRNYQWDVTKELAESLVRYTRTDDAVEVYRFLQEHEPYRLHPENPDFQVEIVRLLSRGFDANLIAAGEARLQLTERYGDGSPWWNANRNDPEALANARQYIEASLLEVAVEVKVRAQESGDPAGYSMAADKYREYLDKFPISDDYFQNQFHLADALYQANRFDEAVSEFEQLVRYAQYHPFGDISVYMTFRAREQLMRDRVGPPDVPYEAAEVEKTYTSVGGVEMTVNQLEDAQRAFIVAADGVLDQEFGVPVEGIDLAGVVDQNRPKIMYLPAQILYHAGRFDEARPRLQAIVDQFPRTDEGAYSANLLLNSYIVEKDNAQIRRWSRAFATMRLGATEELIAEKGQEFQDTLEKSTYLLGREAYERGAYEEAANAYLRFVEEFPASQNVPDALLSAAFNFDRLGRAIDANALYERFVGEFPEHPEAKPFYFSIASNYEATFQLDKAIGFYQELVDRFPDYSDSPNALYMVAFLNEGLGEHVVAAQAYQRYAEDYPEVSDREAVYFRAGAQYEQVGPDDAIRFYRGYLKSYGLENPDHALEAQGKIASILKEQGKERDASLALDELMSLYDEAAEAGATIGPEGRDIAASAAFRAIYEQYEVVVDKELSGDESKDTALLLDQLPGEVGEFDAAVEAFINKYLSFEYITAAVYLQGATRGFYATLGLSMEPPEGMPDDLVDAYWELLEESLFPQFYGVEEQALQKYKRVIELANTQKRHSGWVDEAQRGLNELRPGDYPAVKAPIVGQVQGYQPPTFTPMTVGDYTPDGSNESSEENP
jgi:TolA-binding protein